MDKSAFLETGLSYSPSPVKQYPPMTTSRVISNLDKENVVPCAAQLQTLISTLAQKKTYLKNLVTQKQKLNDIATEQSSKIDSESIKQSYEMEREMDLHQINLRTLEEVECMKKQKLKNMERMLGLKKALEQRYEQIMEMKKLVADLKVQNTETQVTIQEMQRENKSVQDHTGELQLMSQNMDNQVYHMKQAVRQSQVQKQTALTALQKYKCHIEDCLSATRTQNKQARQLTLLLGQTSDKIKRLRQQKSEQQISSSEIMIRNRHIEDTNIKLRNDLEKCKTHLACVMRNNELLTNSIEEFSYMDERVTKVIRKNDLKKL